MDSRQGTSGVALSGSRSSDESELGEERPAKRGPAIPAFLIAAIAVVALGLAAALGNPSSVARFFALIYVTVFSLLWIVLVFMFWSEGREAAAYCVVVLAVATLAPVVAVIALA